MRTLRFPEDKLLPFIAKIATGRHLSAIRDGFAYTIPLGIVGSFILLIVNLPLSDPNNFLYWAGYESFMHEYQANFLQPFYVSLGVISLFVTFGVGYSLAGSYRLPQMTAGILSLFTLMILASQAHWIPLGGNIARWGVTPKGLLPVLDTRFLDPKGVFTGILSAFFAVHIYRLMLKKDWTIRFHPEGTSLASRAVEAVLPFTTIAILAQGVNLLVQSLAGVPLPAVIVNVLVEFLWVGDSYWGMLLIVVLIHLFSFFGLHGTNVLLAITNPIILTNLALNQEANMRDEPIPYIWAGEFFDAYLYLGGTGATLGLAVVMCFSKKPHLRSIGRLSVIPGIFNINEPIIFGAPIIFNPILGIPFLLVPVVNLTIAYGFARTGLIGYMIESVPWTTPAPLVAFLSTGSNWFALVLSCSLLVSSTLIYLPFLRAYERSLA